MNNIYISSAEREDRLIFIYNNMNKIISLGDFTVEYNIIVSEEWISWFDNNFIKL